MDQLLELLMKAETALLSANQLLQQASADTANISAEQDRLRATLVKFRDSEESLKRQKISVLDFLIQMAVAGGLARDWRSHGCHTDRLVQFRIKVIDCNQGIIVVESHKTDETMRPFYYKEVYTEYSSKEFIESFRMLDFFGICRVLCNVIQSHIISLPNKLRDESSLILEITAQISKFATEK